MVEILKQIQGYTAMYNEDRVGTSVPVVGDQLTVERGVNVSEALRIILRKRKDLMECTWKLLIGMLL